MTPSTPPTSQGFVAFVGAGPGDPDLLTLRAVELLREADVVVLDRPEHQALLRHASCDAEVLDATAGDDGNPLTTAARAKLVVSAAKAGIRKGSKTRFETPAPRRVVRLLSGDPFVHSTAAEEAQACAKAGLSFEVVPGIPDVTGVPAYAGTPLTTAKSRGFRVIDAAGPVDWSTINEPETVVVRTSVEDVAQVAAGLTDAGWPGGTPVAVTTLGTTVSQATIDSTLDRVAKDLKGSRLGGPAVLVAGEVVALRDTLSWFETKALFGWRVLVPRTKDQAGVLSALLRRFGAVPEEVPTISVEPPRNPQQMEKAVRGLVEGRYEWVAFTSVNALRAVRERFEEYGLDARAFSGLKVAAVGDKTAAALRGWGINPDLVPSGEQSARGLLEDWPAYDEVLDPINRVFLPRADIATETLVAGLQELGWEVDDVTAYRTVRAAPPPAETREAIKSGKFDAVVFTSSSTVRNLVGIAGKPHATTVIACIGPQTAKTAEEHGLRVDVLAPKPSIEVLVESLAEFGAARRLAMIEAGEPVTKPSERRRSSARRKAR